MSYLLSIFLEYWAGIANWLDSEMNPRAWKFGDKTGGFEPCAENVKEKERERVKENE